MTVQTQVDIFKIGKIWGDRVVVRRLQEPEKKRGLYVPQAYAMKKEQKKVWFGLVIGFGDKSIAEKEFNLKIGDRIAVEPIGQHFLGFPGSDGFDYVWVPDEHICLVDAGSIEEYYADTIDRKGPPKLRVLGNRILVRHILEEQGKVLRPASQKDISTAKWGDVVQIGEGDEIDVAVGDKILCVPEDAGASAEVSLFEPSLTVLRTEDIVLREKVLVPA